MSTGGSGLLGDTVDRDYGRKLLLFNHFAEPELRQAIARLVPTPVTRILDAGCGSGQALTWLSAAAGSEALVVGMDLAAAHAAAARAAADRRIAVLQADLLRPPFRARSFDLVWAVNTLHHLREPTRGLQTLAGLLQPGGRIAIGQSSLLPDMYFAWDSRLERLTNEAVRRYYRDRYGLDERDLTAVRGMLGLLQAAGLRDVGVHTHIIERRAPLAPADEAYLAETIFHDTWGERLRPYLSADDFDELCQLCDPGHERFALRRPDFHFLQTLTFADGAV